jgi:quercetin dioxygenase-like cupin family protein
MRRLTIAAVLLAAQGLVAWADHVPDHAAAIRFVDHDAVAAAFAKGQPLVEAENYKVHASRRDAPGQAEVHEADTDIIHVLSGTASFVTGGAVVEGRTVAPEEVRGSAITGGDERTLVAGDVVIVPAGTPHWFRAVPAPMTYYVVKVRRAGGAR